MKGYELLLFPDFLFIWHRQRGMSYIWKDEKSGELEDVWGMGSVGLHKSVRISHNILQRLVRTIMLTSKITLQYNRYILAFSHMRYRIGTRVSSVVIQIFYPSALYSVWHALNTVSFFSLIGFTAVDCLYWRFLLMLPGKDDDGRQVFIVRPGFCYYCY